MPLIVGPRTDFFPPHSYKFRAKSRANAGLLNRFDGVCKVKSGFSHIKYEDFLT